MLKRKVYDILEASRPTLLSQIINRLLFSLITLNVIAVILQTVEPLYLSYQFFFDSFETLSVLVFSVEYGLRLFSCTADPHYHHPLFGRIRFAMTPLAIVDLLAILPFYITLTNLDLRSLRILRLFRILRIAKLVRYSQSIQTLGRVVVSKKEELVVTITIMVVLLILASTAMYYVEHESQPDKFSSVPMAMWWGIATLTTVGYGDLYPVTPLGMILGSVIALLGIGMFAIPTGVIGAGFLEEIQKTKQGPKKCQHCGRDIN